MLLPMIIFFVPYKKLFMNNYDESIITDTTVHTLILLPLFLMFINTMKQIVLMLNNIMNTALTLSRTFSTKEFKIASVGILIFFVPFITLIFGALLQIDSFYQNFRNGTFDDTYDFNIIGIYITYMFYLIVPLVLQNKYGDILQYLASIPLLVLLYIFLQKYEINIITIYLSSFVINMYYRMSMSDIIVWTVTSFNFKEEALSANNLFATFNLANSVEMQVNTNDDAYTNI